MSLLVGNNLETDDVKCANALNKFFESVFTKGPSIEPNLEAHSVVQSMLDIEFDVETINRKLIELDDC